MECGFRGGGVLRLLSGGVRRWLARVGLLMAPAETCERSTCSKCLTGVGGGGVMGDGARDERRDEGRRENGASRGREQPWLSRGESWNSWQFFLKFLINTFCQKYGKYGTGAHVCLMNVPDTCS